MFYVAFTIICCLVTYLIAKHYIKKSIDLTLYNADNIYKHLNNIVDDISTIKKDIYQ